MALHPEIQAFFDLLKERNPEPVADPTLEEIRAGVELFEEFKGEVPDVPFEEITMPARDGYKIRLRIYNPDLDASHPALVFYPGRGFIVDFFDINCYAAARIASYANAKVIAVDYRICPEADFPIPLYDSYDALEYICKHTTDLKIDPNNISVLGYSSGGHAAAYTASQSRFNNAMHIKQLILLNGAFDFSNSQPHYDEYEAKDVLIDRSTLIPTIVSYLNIPEGELTNPINAPAFEKDVSGFPQTTFIISEYDGVRSDAEHYYQVLSAQNDHIEKIVLEGQTHNQVILIGATPSIKDPAKVIADLL